VTSNKTVTRSRNEIVVGIDDSPAARAALQWAAGQASLTGAALRAVHVLDWPIGLDPSATVQPGTHLQLRDDDVDRAWRRGMARVFCGEVSPRPGWTLQFAQGDIGEVLVRLGAKARMLVVGTKEQSAGDRYRAGSISHYCISHAECPVAAIPDLHLNSAYAVPWRGSDSARLHDSGRFVHAERARATHAQRVGAAASA
jgi:nucleotide-binding universal stress UspA family protein